MSWSGFKCFNKTRGALDGWQLPDGQPNRELMIIRWCGHQPKATKWHHSCLGLDDFRFLFCLKFCMDCFHENKSTQCFAPNSSHATWWKWLEKTVFFWTPWLQASVVLTESGFLSTFFGLTMHGNNDCWLLKKQWTITSKAKHTSSMSKGEEQRNRGIGVMSLSSNQMNVDEIVIVEQSKSWQQRFLQKSKHGHHWFFANQAILSLPQNKFWCMFAKECAENQEWNIWPCLSKPHIVTMWRRFSASVSWAKFIIQNNL